MESEKPFPTFVLKVNNEKIAKNTFLLYVRQIATLLVGFYTVRIVLQVLGIEDYGIYSVIGGVVTLLSFLSATMASATQRFFAFALGQQDQEALRKTFSVNLIIYAGVAATAICILETVGVWFVREKLYVPTQRLEAAIFTYHCSVVAFVVTVLAAPFMAIIIAHEDMHYYAFISIGEVLLKLGAVYLLGFLGFDKLELYGVLVMSVSIATFLIYLVVCLAKYEEVQFKKFYWDKRLLIETTAFTSWTLVGQITTVSRNQGITILINQMFGPLTTASRAIANNITTSLNMFASNFNTGLYPPIIKSYSTGEKREMYQLIFNGSRISFFLMWIFCFPIFLELQMVLDLWLINYPDEVIIFTRLGLVEALLLAVSLPLATAARAPGQMKSYELVLGFFQILLFGTVWFVLKLGYPAYSAYVIAIAFNIPMFSARLALVSKLTGLCVRSFVVGVLVPSFAVALCSISVLISYKSFMPTGFLFSILAIVLSVSVSSFFMYIFCLPKELKSNLRIKIVKIWKQRMTRLR